MTTKEAAALLGKTGLLRSEQDLQVRVKITDVLSEFGLVRYMVTPLDGEGEAKVNADRVALDK